MKAGLNCVMCADIHLDENAFSHKVAEFEHTYVRLPKNQYLRGCRGRSPKDTEYE
jgi:hypothetical protein